MLLPPINGHKLLVVTAKDQNIYLLDRQHLGHWGGEIQRVRVFGQESKTTAAHFLTTGGEHYVYATSAGSPGVVAYKVEIKAGKPTLVEAWRSHIQFGDVAGAAVVVRAAENSDNALVWVAGPKLGTVHQDVLMAFHALNGTVAFDSAQNAGRDAPGSLPHFPPVTCAGNSVFVGTNAGVSCYGPPH